MAPITHFSQLDLSKTYTYADYLTWKFDEFVELIKGQVMRPMAGPSRRYRVYFGKIFGILHPFLKGKSCQVYGAPFEVRLTTGGASGDQQIQNVVQPDICVVCDLAKLDDCGCVGAPDWIIEILSPGNTTRDTRIKFGLYEESGVQEYGIVYPGIRTVAAFTLVEGQYKLTAEYAEPGPISTATLPGLMVEWGDVFGEQ